MLLNYYKPQIQSVNSAERDPIAGYFTFAARSTDRPPFPDRQPGIDNRNLIMNRL